MFGIDFVGVVIAAFVEATVFLLRVISVIFSIASTAQTTKVVNDINKPVSHAEPTQQNAGSTTLGEQLPTEWK